MKQGLYLLLIACVLSGCLFRKPYDIESAQRNELIVADDAYHLSGYKFTDKYSMLKMKLNWQS